MDLERIRNFKTQQLREALKSEKPKDKHSILSIIYPATDHGDAHPPALKQPCTIPSSNDKKCVQSIGEPEKQEPEKDEPGPSKNPMLVFDPNKVVVVPPLNGGHGMANGCLGSVHEEKHRTSPFVQRCVAAITGGTPSDRDDLSGAFAKCVATENKSERNLSKNALRRSGYSDAKGRFVDAITAFKKKRKTSDS